MSVRVTITRSHVSRSHDHRCHDRTITRVTIARSHDHTCHDRTITRSHVSRSHDHTCHDHTITCVGETVPLNGLPKLNLVVFSPKNLMLIVSLSPFLRFDYSYDLLEKRTFCCPILCVIILVSGYYSGDRGANCVSVSIITIAR